MVSVEVTYHDSSKAQHAAVEEEKAGLPMCGKPFVLVHVNPKTAGYAIAEPGAEDCAKLKLRMASAIIQLTTHNLPQIPTQLPTLFKLFW